MAADPDATPPEPRLSATRPEDETEHRPERRSAARPREKHKGPVTLRRRQVETSHDRPAAARHPGPHRLAARRPLAGAAHPVGVRRGIRCARRAGPRGERLRLGPHAAGLRRTTPSAMEVGRRLAEAGYAVITGGGPGVDGGREPRRLRGRRRVRRTRHRAALRAGHERVGRHRRRLPLLLRAQDDVRQVRPGLRRAARWLRHLRRAVRGAVLVQTRKVTSFPVVLLGTAYWSGLVDWLRQVVAHRTARSPSATSTCSP